MFENNPMIIIISDVHLGGGENHPEEFIKFLTLILHKIENNKKFRKNFRALLILGDFFDVLLSTYENISKNHTQIFEILDKICHKGIIFGETLGNHEIPVNGDYNKAFLKRKQDLFREFKQQAGEIFNYSFMQQQHFCQYMKLTSDPGSKKWVLSYHDTKKSFLNFNHSPRIFDLGNAKINSPNPQMMFSHGYQFTPAETQLFHSTQP